METQESKTHDIHLRNLHKKNSLNQTNKSSDFWGVHNISTRFSMITFIISYLIIVISSVMGVEISQPIVDMVWYSALISFVIVTLGINGLDRIINGISNFKNGRNSDYISGISHLGDRNDLH